MCILLDFLFAAVIVSVFQCALSDSLEPLGVDIREALATLLGALVDQLPDAQLIAALNVGNNTEYACHIACRALVLRYGDRVAQNGSADYSDLEAEFWSAQQATVEPSCIIQPISSNEVSTVLQLSRLLKCPFAVKSGGHAAFAGASNIEGGITIDMKLLSQVTLINNNTLASLGPGAKWYDVYTALEPEGLAVVGGRVSAIGVGGLTLGGGISFFSGLYGWACDNVVNYEVVTANGSILNATVGGGEADLFWALRGGGNNFGIVTRFDVPTFSQGLMWGGGRLHLLGNENRHSVISAFMNFGLNSAEDPKAAMILSFAYAQGSYLAQIDLQYSDPVSDPSIFENFTSTAMPGALTDTTTVRTLSNLTQEFNAFSPSGLRETYWASTYKVDEGLVSFILDTFIEEINLISNVSGLVPACTLQFITTPMLQHMQKDNGNALGLADEDGPLLLLNPNTMWSQEADDEAVLGASANIIRKANQYAKSQGLDHEYAYMNYASQFQDPITSYGKGNKERLVAIAERYDPEQVFQKLQPGYFKLDGAPK